MYSSTLFLTSTLGGGEGSASRLGLILPPGKTRYPLYRRLGEPQGRSGHVRKISPPPRFDPRTLQSVASRYTDYTPSMSTSSYSSHHPPLPSIVSVLHRSIKKLFSYSSNLELIRNLVAHGDAREGK